MYIRQIYHQSKYDNGQIIIKNTKNLTKMLNIHFQEEFRKRKKKYVGGGCWKSECQDI